MKYETLTENDRNFFSLVSRAAFTNPFSDERAELDRKITGNHHAPPSPQTIKQVISDVANRINKLDEDGTTSITRFKPPDRDVIEHVFLFDVFHKYIEHFDELIASQAAKQSKSLSVPFARDAISQLTARGFSDSLANRYFSLFYQIRRAFHFINSGLIGQSKSMRQLRMNLWNNIFTHDIRYYERYMWDKMEDFSTILLGPTGCGKGAAAAAIGRSGYIAFDEKKQAFAESFTNTFIPVNISQYPETLLESELFGHAKGAFTGATEMHQGLFNLCGPHGAIFLDEVGEISTQVQVKLLQVLQERVFSPVGSHKNLQFHGRVIAATNKSLDQLRRQGKFRDDFYYRLCSDCIVVSPLSQRIQENPKELDELIAHTVERITGHRAEELIKDVSEVIEQRLGRDYHWPGNVRELAQCIRRIIIKRDYCGDIREEPTDAKARLLEDIESGSLNAQDMLSRYCSLLYDKFGTYEQVARRSGLDRRTVKKYIQHHHQNS